MNTDGALNAAERILAPWAPAPTRHEPGRLDVAVSREQLTDAVAALHQSRWGYLSAITGLDTAARGEFEVLYHFCSGAAIVTVRVRVPKTDAVIPTVCGVIP